MRDENPSVDWPVPEVGQRGMIMDHALRTLRERVCIVVEVSPYLVQNPRSAKATSRVWVRVEDVGELEYSVLLENLLTEPGEAA